MPQINQEKNLALERQEAVKLHNDLFAENSNLTDEEKEWDVKKNTSVNPRYSENSQKMMELRKNVESIDKYREIAKSSEGTVNYEVGDTSSLENINNEKQKIDTEVNKIKNNIEKTSQELNSLREKLGMPPTDEIPSLMDKKVELEKLIAIQNDLESKLNFENKKKGAIDNENKNESNIEQKSFKDNLENLSLNLRGMAREQDSFDFKIIASSLEDFSDIDDLKSKLSKILISVENFAENGLKDNLDDLRENAIKLSQIETSLRDLPSKIKDEEERKEFGAFVSNIANNVGEIASFVKLKASRLQDYLNVK